MLREVFLERADVDDWCRGKKDGNRIQRTIPCLDYSNELNRKIN